jgi:hypothetical protein
MTEVPVEELVMLVRAQSRSIQKNFLLEDGKWSIKIILPKPDYKQSQVELQIILICY